MTTTLVATFLGATVEWVEAYTIVLAVALSIGWRRAGSAALAALAVLALATWASHLALTLVHDLAALQLIIGLFLVLFGVRWLGKAIARGAGLKALHDEEAEFRELRHRHDITEVHAAWWIAFQGVLLEGLEVWLIVVALGVQTHHTMAAGIAAIAALLVVALAGLALHKPLSKVPENAIKFLVGSALLGFGTFWVLEAAGYRWPLADLALPLLIAFYLLGGLVLIRLFSDSRKRGAHKEKAA